MSAARDCDVVVIGGGLSGLATAFALTRRGVAVEVLEAAPRAGGVIASRQRDGALFETGPNSAVDHSPQIGELLAALGIASERIATNPRAATRYIVRDGKLMPLPMSPPAFIASPAFSWRAKLRVAREPFIAPAPPDSDESVAAFVERRLGRELLDYAVDPFVAGVYAGDPERLSLPAAFPRLSALEQRYGSLIRGQLKAARVRTDASGPAPSRASFSFRRGMQTLTDALARAIPSVSTGVAVERVVRELSGTFVVSARRDGESIERRARAVVLAVPADAAAMLLGELAPGAAQALAAIEYAPVATIATVYRRADIGHPLDGFGCLVPKRERRQFLGTLFSSSLFDGRAPPGCVLLTSFLGGMRQPELPAKSDAVLEQVLQAEHAMLLGARAAPVWSEITRWPRAIPQYTLGHRARLAELDVAERDLPGLYVSANYRRGISVGDCIMAASATADSVAEYVGKEKSARLE